jgi:glutathione-specific gamma-glutamylcyclotransferase
MSESHWVFGYGSLIWRPGFSYVHSQPARLEGWHRSLCVLSHKYRGTAECLGLVFGLDEGGFCNGVAFEVQDQLWPETYAYLTARELITPIYKEVYLTATLSNGTQIKVMTYVVDQSHAQYAGQKTEAEILAYVRQGIGEAGRCTDYVQNTAAHLRLLGIPDPELEHLVKQI